MSPSAFRLVPRRSEPLMRRLRRVLGLFSLFIACLLASIHWFVREIQETVAAGAGREVTERVAQIATRLEWALAIAGCAMVPIVVVAARLVRRYVTSHHLQELAEASFRKSQFVSLATSELRNPLCGMYGFAELLAAGAYGPLTPEQAVAVRHLRRSTADLKRLLDDILDQVNVEAHRVLMRREEFAPADVLQEALAAAEPQARRMGVDLVLSAMPCPRVLADRTRVKQVALNLVVNALRASPPGTAVECRLAPAGGHVRVSVVDRGEGRRPSDQEDPFEEVRGVRSARSVAEGTDLDLAVCRHLVELLGGRIWTESDAPAGSAFHFTLPAAR